ncbi:galectin-4-like isoform X1 [Centruroides sculpturatus]|uniref:galectin-4-like isoform X1 n=1 Tax=Centruroides sculpturatus TaxID=218467 RepID=UPI000C6E967F|nr:galectin-4-like isoform X1 [Centruroides sculpturatus]
MKDKCLDFKIKYPSMAHYVEDVPLPYWGRIPNGLQPGKMIMISGSVNHGANRFHIDFSRGNTRHDCDIALHFNPRFEQRVVVRNSYENGRWQNEEIEPYSLPFTVGKDFVILFLVEQNHFKIAVNGRHYTEFKHRLPYQTIDKLNIEGSVKISRIEYTFESYRPPPGAQICPPAPPVLQICTQGPYLPKPVNFQPVYNPRMPFNYTFAEPLLPSTMLYISGRVTAFPNSFTLDFRCRIGDQPPADVAFHFNARFNQNVVVRNSYINSRWGAEERHGRFPFAPGTHFDMVIRIETDKFMVAINGAHFTEYRHRIMPLSRIFSLDFNGDIVLSCIKMSRS